MAFPCFFAVFIRCFCPVKACPYAFTAGAPEPEHAFFCFKNQWADIEKKLFYRYAAFLPQSSAVCVIFSFLSLI
jgi:hypothetical protein